LGSCRPGCSGCASRSRFALRSLGSRWARRASQGANISCAEMPGEVHHYRCAGDTDSIDAGDICVRLSSCRTDTDGARFEKNTYVADINIVIARDKIRAGLKAQCNIAVAHCVTTERFNTVCRVGGAGGVASESKKTAGRVGKAGGVALERTSANGRVVEAGGVALERSLTGGRVGGAGGSKKESTSANGRVVDAGGDVEKRAITVSGVASAIGIRGRRKRKADEYERNKKESEPQRRPAD